MRGLCDVSRAHHLPAKRIPCDAHCLPPTAHKQDRCREQGLHSAWQEWTAGRCNNDPLNRKRRKGSRSPCLMASLRACAARRRAEGLERELQSMWDAAEAQRAWMAKLQEDLTAALEDGQEQHDAAAALAKEVDALRACLAGALSLLSPCSKPRLI